MAVALVLAMPGRMARAEDAIDIDTFERLVTGRVFLHYLAGPEPYGIEEYLPGRRVRWAFAGDTCIEGRYYPQGDFICFAYDGLADEQCWTYRQTAAGLTAAFRDDGPDGPLYRLRPSPEPLACTGPDVGV